MTVKHVIIGGGPAATNAVETIRQLEADPSEITLICDEPAHSRMALPYWIAGSIPREHTYTADDRFFERLQVNALIGLRARQLDTAARTVTCDDGQSVAYDNLLIATGSSPVVPEIPGAELPQVQPMWSLDHAQNLLEAAAQWERPRVVLIGAGFIGSIVLNAMFHRKWDLTVVEQANQLLPGMLDADAAELVRCWLTEHGVKVHLETKARGIELDGKGKVVELENGEKLPADVVILATGIRANLDLVDGTPIDTDQAILVDDRMQTNVEGVYAGGDVAQGPVLGGGPQAVHAIQPTAVDHGRVAGANMAGREVHYPGSLRMNVADVCGIQCASFGQWEDPAAEVTLSKYPEGFIYRKLLWHDDQLVGAVFTGRANDVGMLTDVGMIKGMLQTQTRVGSWKKHLQENPFDIRRAYIGCGVAGRLMQQTLLGRPTADRQYRFGNMPPSVEVPAAHQVFFGGSS